MATLENHQSIVRINIPGSKSLSHRYLIAAALASGESELEHVQDSSDISVTKRLLEGLGVKISGQDPTCLKVRGLAGKVTGGLGRPMDCDVGESGTTCRLLSAVLAAGHGLFNIYGHGRMHQRPVAELCDALTKLGAGICYKGNAGCPPFLLQAQGLDPELLEGELSLGMETSSQYFSGLLLAAPLATKPLVLHLGGTKAISWPYVSLTLQCLKDFQIPFTVAARTDPKAPWVPLEDCAWREVTLVKPGCLRISVQPAPYVAGHFHIESDWSSASYFLAAGVLGDRPVCVEGLHEDSLQGDRIILDILAKMGAEIHTEPHGITSYPSKLHGVELDMGSSPDLVQTVAILAAFAKGSTRIRNVAHLRFKESDRLQAPAEELGKIGVVVDTLSDGLLISGRGDHVKHKPINLVPGSLSAHNDHRMAMSLALLELRHPEIHVAELLDNPNCVHKSFPSFWQLWSKVVPAL
ncbi:MAG: 3-phosphoshikimate 1-carboxyvinyltransferase [Desulfovibrionaceae bacterium]|nr:3-phosphoshikimate 1-carboxyvinyltransferase [Desulfovibrionaceae bacterium]